MNWKLIIFIALIAYGGYHHFHQSDSNQFIASQASTEGVVTI